MRHKAYKKPLAAGGYQGQAQKQAQTFNPVSLIIPQPRKKHKPRGDHD